jgi:hypothetical protein
MSNLKKRRLEQAPEYRLLLIIKEEERIVYLSAPIGCESEELVRDAIEICPWACEPGLAQILVHRIVRRPMKPGEADKLLTYDSEADGQRIDHGDSKLSHVKFDARVLIPDNELQKWTYDMTLFVKGDENIDKKNMQYIAVRRPVETPLALYQPVQLEGWFW